MLKVEKMTDKKTSSEEKYAELERRLKEAQKEALYYQELAEEAGRRSVREIDHLSKLIEKLKKTEDELIISEERYRTLIENAPLGIYYNDSKGTFLYGNKKAEEIIGYKKEALIGKSFLKLNLLSPKDIIKAARLLSLNIKGKATGPAEFKLNRKDGVQRVVEINTEVITINGKKAVLGMVNDITERKRIDDERQRLEEQLHIRQKIDSLGTLAGGIAHDINNLLAVIMGNIDLVRMSANALTVKHKDYIERAYQSCERAANLIHEIQMFSMGTVSEKSSIDVYSIANDVFKILDSTIDKLIKKTIDFKPEQFYVTANADLIHHVLFNLGTNSVHAIEDRGVKPGDYIRISSEKYTSGKRDKTGLPEGKYIHILFEDNGKGMPEEVKVKAFDPLFTTRRGTQKGQGLGLAMVYNIVVSNHEGYIDIETAERKGTTFHIYLPEAHKIEKTEKIKDIEVTGGNETVLVIEDDLAVRDFVFDTLNLYGYNILTANDGEEGLEIFRAQQDKIDLVLLDLTMPVMSGETVLGKIMNIQPDAKVIISSGHSEEEHLKYKMAKGYIPKPYKIKNLAKLIRNTLDM